MRKLFLTLDGHFIVNFFAIFATFYTFSSFNNQSKNPTIRTAVKPSGNVSDAFDEWETDSENLSDFQSSVKSESEVESETEEEVLGESSSTKSDSDLLESIPTAKPSKHLLQKWKRNLIKEVSTTSMWCTWHKLETESQ